ncbi:type II toxin-antitoxin system RelE/ParE family toxin [Phaeobacter italicus]|jgi:toxin ParE1/3/4|uniref:type II toxin-antitoxin system RelE/ParE family toxin n=1 Tax=Phaeobacter italicus TaxID=481446 RepID=UPI001ADCBEC6|nr:type II toxin-antitoxin system RelE/ParE family toxin [Phaeobacter italicus]MBO9444133.1 type II toxin-antitoxin system RelE/ParE family toxin [Phaeobacter italicus]
MPSDTPSHYRLTPKAHQDLEGIWRYTAENWSVTQADKYLDGITSSFDTFVQTPRIVRERTEFDPPIRVFTHEKHIIVYVIEADHIAIVRLLGGQQDWHSILQRIDT